MSNPPPFFFSVLPLQRPYLGHQSGRRRHRTTTNERLSPSQSQWAARDGEKEGNRGNQPTAEREMEADKKKSSSLSFLDRRQIKGRKKGEEEEEQEKATNTTEKEKRGASISGSFGQRRNKRGGMQAERRRQQTIISSSFCDGRLLSSLAVRIEEKKRLEGGA